MIKGLAHVCFIVRNLEASIEFYQGKLGFRHAFDFIDAQGKRTGAYFLIGGRNFIEMFTGEVGVAAEKPSYRHFCVEVDDIEKTVADLRAKGVEVTPIARGSDRSWQAWVTDPDGNRIEMQAYTPESKQEAALRR